MQKLTKYWFTSDVHWNHKNIIKYDNRPFQSKEEMNDHIVKSWSVVKDGDTLWSLGDFAFGKISEIMSMLREAKTDRFDLRMVTGNHDKEIIKNRRLLLDSGLVKEIVPYKEITINYQHIVLFHYGCRVWNRSHHGSILLYGHSHGSLPPLGKSVDVGLDAPWITGEPVYRPYNYTEIETFMKNRNISNEDAHKKERDE